MVVRQRLAEASAVVEGAQSLEALEAVGVVRRCWALMEVEVEVEAHRRLALVVEEAPRCLASVGAVGSTCSASGAAVGLKTWAALGEAEALLLRVVEE